jgi:hypothetical protein
MKRIFTTLFLLHQLFSYSQSREELLDYEFKPVANGAYYFGTIEKKDSLFHRKVWFISQKTMFLDGWYKDESCKTEHGPFFYFHHNGVLKRTGQFVDGKKDGVWLLYDEEGRLKDSSNYTSGFLKGISLGWNKNGYLSDSSNFDGKGNGTQVHWYDNGSVSVAGYMKQDTLKSGRWKYYHPNGTVMAIEEYDDAGKLTRANCFDDKGVALDTSLCRDIEAYTDLKQWRRFLEKSLTPLIESKARQGIQGHFTVMIRFLVDEEGGLSDITPLTGYGYGIEEGVVKIFKNSPKWKPAKMHGKNVKSYHMQPVTFVIQ